VFNRSLHRPLFHPFRVPQRGVGTSPKRWPQFGQKVAANVRKARKRREKAEKAEADAIAQADGEAAPAGEQEPL
jgi:hypothetical protein